MADGSVSTLTNPVTGSGTTNTVPKFTGSTTIGNSQIIDNGTTVGIGVTPTTNKLEVGGGITIGTGFTNNTDIRFNNATNGKIQYIFSDALSGDLGLEAGASVGIKFNTNGANTRMAIFSDGNVTIGNSPSNAGFKLDVNGTGRFSDNLRISKSSNSGSGSGFPRFTVQNTLATQGDGSSTFNFADINISSGNEAVNMFLATTFAAGTWAPAGIINVATNHELQFKTNNTTRLTLANSGAATFSSSVAAKSNVTVSNNGGENPILSVVSAFADGYRATLRLWNQHTGGKAWEVYSTNDADGVYGGGKLAFVNTTNSVNAMTITSSGNVLIGTLIDTGGARRLQVAGDVFVDDNTTTGNGVQLKNADRPLITRGWDAFTSGNKTGVGRWGVYMESAELFLGSPGTDYSGGLVSIGGWLINGTKQSNLTVNNQTRRVGIGFNNPSLKLSLGNDVGRKFFVYDDGGGSNDIGGGMGTDLGGFSAETSIFFGNFSGSGRLSIGAWTSSQTYATRLTVFAGGNVSINSTSDNGNRLRVNGTIFSDSSVTATSFFESSDATIKTLVEDAYQAKGIDSVVAKLYIKNGKQELGYYAQDLEGVLPSAVNKGSDGLLNLSYREVHTAKIASLEKRIEELEQQLKTKL
jgi:hypothetical protein